VKALRTIADAVALRTPRIGRRVSRSATAARVGGHGRGRRDARACLIRPLRGEALDVLAANDAFDAGRLHESEVDPSCFAS
jgi:hypothetical protein